MTTIAELAELYEAETNALRARLTQAEERASLLERERDRVVEQLVERGLAVESLKGQLAKAKADIQGLDDKWDARWDQHCEERHKETGPIWQRVRKAEQERDSALAGVARLRDVLVKVDAHELESGCPNQPPCCDEDEPMPRAEWCEACVLARETIPQALADPSGLGASSRELEEARAALGSLRDALRYCVAHVPESCTTVGLRRAVDAALSTDLGKRASAELAALRRVEEAARRVGGTGDGVGGLFAALADLDEVRKA